ncbi:hypothetical protein CCM_08615 [Cordyceps militaris CM01]|uniref:Uncharacterized protein n=1 Tax=Cordyceps militaris (strain CM01) TaxID=983644 RepID=G3JRG7_CORMM|nr:uncharacterized protein CCM_08615 [Cordyceps militaris CM01]EGX88570.1 hypothetical protein CCM_08615 [Cordyceps militaris CM01]
MDVSLYSTTLEGDPALYVHYRDALSRDGFYGKVYRILKTDEGVLSVKITAICGVHAWGSGEYDDPQDFLFKSCDEEELPAFYQTKDPVCMLSSDFTGGESYTDGGRLEEIFKEQIEGDKTPEEVVENVISKAKIEKRPTTAKSEGANREMQSACRDAESETRPAEEVREPVNKYDNVVFTEEMLMRAESTDANRESSPGCCNRAEKGITESEFGLVEERARATTDNSNNLLS